MSAHPIDQHLPFPNNRIAVVSITRHGIALAGRIIAALPGATLFAPQKFHTEAAAAAPGAFACYEGKVGDQVPALFAGFDGIIAIVSLGAVVRLIAPHLKRRKPTLAWSWSTKPDAGRSRCCPATSAAPTPLLACCTMRWAPPRY